MDEVEEAIVRLGVEESRTYGYVDRAYRSLLV